MKLFANLINALDSTNKTLLKQEAIRAYLSQADDKDKIYFLALFTGKTFKRPLSTTLLKQWTLELTGFPEWLFQESYTAVGDLGETIALLLPPPVQLIEKPLHVWIKEIDALRLMDVQSQKAYVLNSWKSLNTLERFIFNKLIGGHFRIGVSAKTLINTIALYYHIEASAVAHSIMGTWSPSDVNFEALVTGRLIDTHLSKPYPFCLAYPIDQPIEALGDISDWQIEYKWDGIRGQIITRKGEQFIWSRGEELVTKQFPELLSVFKNSHNDVVVDGEIVAYKDNQILPFADLQKRLNRKLISPSLLNKTPIAFIVYDLLEFDGEDIRARPLYERRQLLESWYLQNATDNLLLSQKINCPTWAAVKDIRNTARAINSEGLMVKKKTSNYTTGRQKGIWWKWKLEPLTIDAVLIYAQKGSGRRSGHYTDYTFAVKDGDELVSIAKAYSGLTDKEIQEVSKWINQHVKDKFGPVRTVDPVLVFEIGFEGISYSSRHKSGVALRFPRIVRWRRDKTIHDIDDIQEIKKLIP